MRVIVELDWNDDERALLTTYFRRTLHETGLPRLARRVDIQAFVAEALLYHWCHIGTYLEDQPAWDRKLAQLRATWVGAAEGVQHDGE